MNKEKRRSLGIIVSQIEEIRQDISFILSQEQSCLDNMPENLEGSERYEKFENSVENLEDATDSLGDAIRSIEEAIN